MTFQEAVQFMIQNQKDRQEAMDVIFTELSVEVNSEAAKEGLKLWIASDEYLEGLEDTYDFN